MHNINIYFAEYEKFMFFCMRELCLIAGKSIFFVEEFNIFNYSLYTCEKPYAKMGE